ncbi:hypothetical protein [uncultured Bacteroides sp.]|uniref:hypothetical protein n=1 Tax=uncultured Bacteroides sp. TaxID=162156 RepID=UPI00338E3AA6
MNDSIPIHVNGINRIVKTDCASSFLEKEHVFGLTAHPEKRQTRQTGDYLFALCTVVKTVVAEFEHVPAGFFDLLCLVIIQSATGFYEVRGDRRQ